MIGTVAVHRTAVVTTITTTITTTTFTIDVAVTSAVPTVPATSTTVAAAAVGTTSTPDQLRVKTAAQQQLPVRAGLGDGALVHAEDVVTVVSEVLRQVVRDHDHRVAPHVTKHARLRIEYMRAGHASERAHNAQVNPVHARTAVLKTLLRRPSPRTCNNTDMTAIVRSCRVVR
jgi:hypothetical protein